jgi:hypothetical protein
MKGTSWGRQGRGGGYAGADRRRRRGSLLPLLMGLLCLAACGGGPATGTPLPGATVVSGGRTRGTACVGGGCEPIATMTHAPTATPTLPIATPIPTTTTAALTATTTVVPPTATVPPPTTIASSPTVAPTADRTPAVAPAGQYLPGYPPDFFITREVTMMIDGTPFIVGVPDRYLGNPLVEEVIRAFVHNTRLIDQALETGDESLLMNATSGPELDCDLPALRQLRDKGQSTRVRRQWIRLAFVTLQGDKVGVFVVTSFATVTVDRNTGEELHRTDPKEISYVTVLQQAGGVWKNNDSRSLQ